MSDNCKVCGKSKGRNKYFCSKACESKYRQHQRICPVCGKLFDASPANDTVCCSPECSSIHRKQLHKNGKYDSAIIKWQNEKEKFFEEHTGEKHINAKHWKIKAPDGQIYDCQNLMYFIRENSDLNKRKNALQRFSLLSSKYIIFNPCPAGLLPNRNRKHPSLATL